MNKIELNEIAELINELINKSKKNLKEATTTKEREYYTGALTSYIVVKSRLVRLFGPKTKD